MAWFMYCEGFAASSWIGAAWSGESGVPEEVPLRLPSLVISITEGRPQIGHSKAIQTVLRSKWNSKDPAVQPKARKEGLKVNQRPRGGCPLRSGQPDGYCPARNRVPKILRDNESLPMDLRIEGKPIKGVSHQFLKGCAKNRQNSGSER